jgi:hypothetical protein
MSVPEPWFAALRARVVFAVLRRLPLSDMPPRNRLIWRVWIKLVERRYRYAEAKWGRERARVYDYVPF